MPSASPPSDSEAQNCPAHRTAPTTTPRYVRSSFPVLLSQRQREAQIRAYYRRRTYYATTGMVICMIAIWVIVASVDLPPKPEQTEGPPSSIEALGGGRDVIIVGTGDKGANQDVEQVPT